MCVCVLCFSFKLCVAALGYACMLAQCAMSCLYFLNRRIAIGSFYEPARKKISFIKMIFFSKKKKHTHTLSKKSKTEPNEWTYHGKSWLGCWRKRFNFIFTMWTVSLPLSMHWEPFIEFCCKMFVMFNVTVVIVSYSKQRVSVNRGQHLCLIFGNVNKSMKHWNISLLNSAFAPRLLLLFPFSSSWSCYCCSLSKIVYLSVVLFCWMVFFFLLLVSFGSIIWIR